MPEGLCGCLSLNLRIFIKNFLGKQLDFKILRFRGAIYITLLHEFENYLRRIDCRKRYEYAFNIAPSSEEKKSKNITKENKELWNDIIFNSLIKRGGSGYELERKIFGNKVKVINDEGVLEFININKFTSLEEFKVVFNQKVNDNARGILIINRDANTTIIPECAMRYMPYLIKK